MTNKFLDSSSYLHWPNVASLTVISVNTGRLSQPLYLAVDLPAQVVFGLTASALGPGIGHVSATFCRVL